MWYKSPLGYTLDGWDKWSEETKTQHPVQYFFRETVAGWLDSIFFRVSRVWWALKHRVIPKHRHHVLRPRSLKPGYHDPDSKIRAAAFDILSEHAEGLMGDGVKGTLWEEIDIPETDDDGRSFMLEQIDREAEIIELRNWWVNVRPARDVEDIAPPPDEPEGAPFLWMIREEYEGTEEYEAFGKWAVEAGKVEEDFAKEDEEKFIQLVKLLPHLWN